MGLRNPSLLQRSLRSRPSKVRTRSKSSSIHPHLFIAPSKSDSMGRSGPMPRQCCRDMCVHARAHTTRQMAAYIPPGLVPTQDIPLNIGCRPPPPPPPPLAQLDLPAPLDESDRRYVGGRAPAAVRRGHGDPRRRRLRLWRVPGCRRLHGCCPSAPARA